MNLLAIGQQVSGIIEKIVFSGLGLMRHQGFVIFVHGGVPGETVLVEITSIKSNLAHATLIQVLCPKKNRIAPACPHFGTCGGCQLQHIDYPSQVLIKKNMLHEALYKLYHEEIPFFPSERPFSWRRKITLHAKSTPSGWIVGFYGLHSIDLVPITICPIFSQQPSPLNQAKDLISCLHNLPNRSCDITLFHLEEGVALFLHAPFDLSSSEQKRLLTVAQSIPFFAYHFRNTKGSIGSTNWTFQLFSKTWHFSSDCFIQNHLSMCSQLWKDIIDKASSLAGQEPILDLYSGICVTAIELASRGHHVYAVEYAKEAVDCAKRTWQQLPQKQSCTLSIHNSTVERFLSKWKKPVGCIIVNPPRAGLSKEALQAILKIPHQNLLYISCSPATLARDLQRFIAHGAALQSVVGYDLFPQTSHFETIATLTSPI